VSEDKAVELSVADARVIAAALGCADATTLGRHALQAWLFNYAWSRRST
jgi:hypothetical protein